VAYFLTQDVEGSYKTLLI